MNAKVNNLSPLPFYSDLNFEKLRSLDVNRWYSNGQLYPLLVRNASPFFIPRVFEPGTEEGVNDILVYKLKGDYNSKVDIKSFEEVTSAPGGGYWVEYFFAHGLGSTPTGDLIFMPNGTFFEESGYYMIRIDIFHESEPIENLYSEIFKVEADHPNMLIEWGNENDLICGNDKIPYSTVLSGAYKKFVNTIAVDSGVGFPEYTLDEEGEERMGYFYPVKQVSNKKYKFTFYAPEYLCDCLRLIPLAENIRVFDKDRGSMYPTQFNIDFTWLEGGHYAKVDCEFTTDKVVHIIGNDLKFK